MSDDSSASFEIDTPVVFTTGTTGEPGHRVFYLQAQGDGLVVSLKLEKQQVGALVSPTSGVITTVSTLDPIKVYFTASEQEYLDFARRFPTAESRQADFKNRDLELILSQSLERKV